ncbi:MAG TPA: hypothetical protein VJT73_10690, partial [Polyangiaceae bacterium]|nr:hypothetical protein [Polyangiaceae bacterium]
VRPWRRDDFGKMSNAEKVIARIVDPIVRYLRTSGALRDLTDDVVAHLRHHAGVRELVDDIVGYLQSQDSVRDLISTQSAGVAVELVSEARGRVRRADSRVDRVMARLLRRPARGQ